MEQVSKKETEQILALAQSTLNTEGDWVEFGCYKGATSVLLAKLLQNQFSPKLLYLYDSFAGLPEKSPEDTSSAGENFKPGELSVTKREVIEKLRRANLNLKNIKIKKAFFSDLNPATDLPEKISFAFLDGDLYSSIKTSLNLILPKLTKGAVVIVHDYNNPELPGSTKAVDEFLRLHPNFTLRVFHTLAIMVSEE